MVRTLDKLERKVFYESIISLFAGAILLILLVLPAQIEIVGSSLGEVRIVEIPNVVRIIGDIHPILTLLIAFIGFLLLSLSYAAGQVSRTMDVPRNFCKFFKKCEVKPEFCRPETCDSAARHFFPDYANEQDRQERDWANKCGTCGFRTYHAGCLICWLGNPDDPDDEVFPGDECHHATSMYKKGDFREHIPMKE